MAEDTMSVDEQIYQAHRIMIYGHAFPLYCEASGAVAAKSWVIAPMAVGLRTSHSYISRKSDQIVQRTPISRTHHNCH